MTTLMAVWISANKLGFLALSKSRCMEYHRVLTSISESGFVRFGVPNLKACYSIC